MKTFDVHLRDGRTVKVVAENYRHEGNQYVFDKESDDEVQFFLDSEVIGVVEARPNTVHVAKLTR